MEKEFSKAAAPSSPNFHDNPVQPHAGGSNGYGKDEDDALYPGPPGIPLTDGETALIMGIFGDGIDTKNIRKYFSETEKPGSAAGYVIPAQTFGVDCIKFYGAQYASDDYSQTDDIFTYGTFVHEMTHIWQNQQRSRNKAPYEASANDNNDYAYTLTPQTRFGKLGEEQQAKIIEDYARQFLYPKRPPAEKNGKYKPSFTQSVGMQDLYDLKLLQKVVEDAFPQARKTRMALESQIAQKPPRSPKPDV